jgi:hypothetical protein
MPTAENRVSNTDTTEGPQKVARRANAGSRDAPFGRFQAPEGPGGAAEPFTFSW